MKNDVLKDKEEQKKPIDKKTKFIFGVIVFAVGLIISILFPELATAYETPAATDPGYDFYDLVVEKGLKGPLGFAAGCWLLMNAGTTIGQNPKMAGLQAIGGGMLIKADAVAVTLGWMV